MKTDKQQSDETNRLILQQIVQTQPQLNRAYAQMATLQTTNIKLNQQIYSSVSAKPNPSPKVNTAQTHSTESNAHHTKDTNPQPPSPIQQTSASASPQPIPEEPQPSLNQALLDMLHAQRGCFEN